MTRLRRAWRSRAAACVVALLCMAGTSCMRERSASPRLYAASSLVPAVSAMPAAGAPPFVPVHAATSLLAQQLREGAPPGVLITADARWADALADEGLIEPDLRVPLLAGRLVVVVPSESGLDISSLEELTGPQIERVALAETSRVPLGRYSRAALDGAGVWGRLRERVIEVTDARAVVALVAGGEADAGIAYASDAGAPGVRAVLDVPAHLHEPVEYPLLLVRGADANARALWTWLQGDEAAGAFERAGFELVDR